MQLRLSIVQKPDAKSDDHNGVCWAYLEQNKPTQARPYCQKAVDLESSNYAALVNLGHTWLLTGDKTQAMPWYRQSLRRIRKEEELKQGPLADFDLFIKSGWAMADAQASKAWYEQGWTTLQGLNAVRKQLSELSLKGQGTEVEAMRLALKAMNDSATLLGDDAALVEIFARRYMASATDLAKRQIEKIPNTTAKKTIDSAFSVVGHRLTPNDIWFYWDRLAEDCRDNGQTAKALELHQTLLTAQQTQLPADDEKVLDTNSEIAFDHHTFGQYDKALALEEKVLAARTAKLGADHPDTLTSMENLSLTLRKLNQYAKAQALLQKYLPLKVTRDGEKNDSARLVMALLVRTEDALGRSSGFLKRYSPETQAAVKDKVARLRVTGD